VVSLERAYPNRRKAEKQKGGEKDPLRFCYKEPTITKIR